MSPVLLGTTLLAVFVLALAVRAPLEHAYVLSASEIVQPKRQFLLDMFLCLLAGIMVAVFNELFYGFPIIESGGKLVLGCTVAGFFFSLDMALARERNIINAALEMNKPMPPPIRLYSMTRKFSLVSIATALFVSFIVILVISKDITWLSKIDQNAIPISQAQGSIMYEIVFIMIVLLAMVINLIFSYSKNLKILFDNETNILEQVSRGDLSELVPVATSDEFGIIALHTNTMIHGLRHRIELITALKIAEEIQLNLLPRTAPSYPGIDISGTSIYCDETGGDYYDYLKLPNGRLGVVVADASDHGVGSALYMTTARAFLLFGARDFTSPSQLLDDVNHFLAKDSSETGRFMSLFFLEIDSATQTLCWVRAGHEPAIYFDAAQETFLELKGKGMALGVEKDLKFREYKHHDWTTGSVIVIGTDGIRETRNQKGEMFGMDRLRQVIKNHASENAETIRNAVIDTLRVFQDDAPQEDDITVVVIKLI